MGDEALVNDAQAYGVGVEFCTPPTDGTYFRLLSVHHLTGAENHGNHHLYFDVLYLDGARYYGAVINLLNANGVLSHAFIDKPREEPGANVPMYKQDTYAVWVDGQPSDKVVNLHPAHPDEPGGNTLYHHSFYIKWQLTKGPSSSGGGPTPTPTPTPVPTWQVVSQSDTEILLRRI
jgi:hypothetical protein